MPAERLLLGRWRFFRPRFWKSRSTGRALRCSADCVPGTWRKAPWFPLYMAAYCVFRFLVEFIRIEPRVALGLTAYQWIAAVGLAVFCYELRTRLSREGACESTA